MVVSVETYMLFAFTPLTVPIAFAGAFRGLIVFDIWNTSPDFTIRLIGNSNLNWFLPFKSNTLNLSITLVSVLTISTVMANFMLSVLKSFGVKPVASFFNNRFGLVMITSPFGFVKVSSQPA